MNVLLLGGGVFLGRHLIDALLERGHAVTTYTRGVRAVPGGDAVTRLTGNREGALDDLPADGWDAVVDTSGYLPRFVRASAQRLAGAGRYAFVSSVSVYDEAHPAPDESAPVAGIPPDLDPEMGSVDGRSYGPYKAACEAAVRETFGDRALIVRPGLIVGPYDPTDRFTYWPERFLSEGDVLAPAPAQRAVQFVDVRDVAAFTVRALEDGRGGNVNVTSPPDAVTMGEVVYGSRAASESEADVAWVDETFLEREGVEPWTGLPLWLPESLGLPGLTNANVDRALGWGMTLRPLATTIADTLAWVRTLPRDRERKAGITAEREAELLQAWRAAT